MYYLFGGGDGRHLEKMSIIMSEYETCENGNKIEKKIAVLGNLFFHPMHPKSK